MSKNWHVNTIKIHNELHFTMLNKDAFKFHAGCTVAQAYSFGLGVSCPAALQGQSSCFIGWNHPLEIHRMVTGELWWWVLKTCAPRLEYLLPSWQFPWLCCPVVYQTLMVIHLATTWLSSHLFKWNPTRSPCWSRFHRNSHSLELLCHMTCLIIDSYFRIFQEKMKSRRQSHLNKEREHFVCLFLWGHYSSFSVCGFLEKEFKGKENKSKLNVREEVVKLPKAWASWSLPLFWSYSQGLPLLEDLGPAVSCPCLPVPGFFSRPPGGCLGGTGLETLQLSPKPTKTSQGSFGAKPRNSPAKTTLTLDPASS